MRYVKGEILTKNGFEKRFLTFNDNKNVKINKGLPPEKPIAEGIITPTFINAHTHIGDSFIRKKNIELPKNVEKLVGPPNGLKHQLLKNTSDDEIIEGMEESINQMIKNDTSIFCDFREEGICGIHQLKAALKNKNIDSVILSRPSNLEYDKDEIKILLKNSEGIGLSSIFDWDYSVIKKIAKRVKQQKKIFALHASETIRENIDQILDLKPNFLVHMIKATESDFIRLKENDIPIVICPRANAFFNLKPNYKLLKQVGIDLMLGTDNSMLNPPNILEELRYLKNSTSLFTIEELLNMITYTPRKALNLDCDIWVPSSLSKFIVLDRKSLEPISLPFEQDG